MPRCLLPHSRPAHQHNACRKSNRKRTEEQASPGIGYGVRQDQATIAQKHARQRLQAVGWPGQRPQHRKIPEEELKQQRNVSHQLDIAGGNLRQQPVA